METCVIIQGPTVCDNVSMNKQSWKGYPIIFSTWEGSDMSCYQPTDLIILNEYPEEKGVKNLNLQIISTLSGLYKAKELGFKRAIKWREDFYPTNPSELLKLFKPECINFNPNIEADKIYMANWNHFHMGPADMWFYGSEQTMNHFKNLYQTLEEQMVIGSDFHKFATQIEGNEGDLSNSIAFYKWWMIKNGLWEKRINLETTWE